MHAVSTKAGLKTTLRAVRILATISAGGLLLLSGSASSQTITPQSVDPMQHFIDCAGVLISAPSIHAKYCMPSNIPPEMKSLASDDDNGCAHVMDAVDDDKDPCRPLPDDNVSPQI
ncbi:MAG: hypothetical protein J0I99_18955 [Devosia sp.]|uniref:hypothetical protein n=1 Tax=Devosia sp. TaxID=1871048 RepID=UPI001AD2FBF4|nr:hypothetical protein [Devosia sp.]MBN9317823.1 hypothetical protein [Devosia sp.]